MKKICVTILSIAMLFTMTGIISVAAKDSYTYVRNEDIISEIVYQDFEDLEPMEDYATSNHKPDQSDAYGFYSFVGNGSNVMVTDDKPISGDQSLRCKDTLDARKWSIYQLEFDADAYVMEFKIRIDDMPAGGKFNVKISDVNSNEKDNESPDNPILSFRNEKGEIGLYNLSDVLVSELEANKVYSMAIVCQTLSTDYFIFLNEKYVGKYEFNVEFERLSSLRFDLSGTGTVITIDDILVDGCELSNGASEATEVPTQEPTKAPTTAAATATVKPAPATSTSAPSDTEEDSGFPTWAIVAIAVSAVVVIAVVVVIVAKKKKK
jgi:hypothetical protein